MVEKLISGVWDASVESCSYQPQYFSMIQTQNSLLPLYEGWASQTQRSGLKLRLYRDGRVLLKIPIEVTLPRASSIVYAIEGRCATPPSLLIALIRPYSERPHFPTTCYLQAMSNKEKEDVKEMIQFIMKMLKLYPKDRPTAAELLQDKFFSPSSRVAPTPNGSLRGLRNGNSHIMAFESNGARLSKHCSLPCKARSSPYLACVSSAGGAAIADVPH